MWCFSRVLVQVKALEEEERGQREKRRNQTYPKPLRSYRSLT